MRAQEVQFDEVLTVDIHGFYVHEAKQYLERLLASIDTGVYEVVVIHGYRGGTALKDMVRRDLKSKRIYSWMETSNPGVTSLILKDMIKKSKTNERKNCH